VPGFSQEKNGNSLSSQEDKMPRIPFIAPAHKGADNLSDAPQLKNLYIDERGVLRQRPGLYRWSLFDSTITGTYWWKHKKLLVVIAGGKLYFSSNGSASFTQLGSAIFSLTTPVVFDSNNDYLFMADGGQPKLWDGTNVPAATTGQAFNATHVCFMNGYFLANETATERIWYTTLGGTPPTWDSYFSAEGGPDFAVCIASGYHEIFIGGESTVEAWYNTGVLNGPFARIEGSFVERGLASPYAFTLAGNNWYWLDQERKLIRLEGRSPRIVSLPFDQNFQDLEKVSDSILFNLDRWIVITFPTDERTFAYDTVTEGWSEWTNFENDEEGAFLGNHSSFVVDLGLWLVTCSDNYVSWFNKKALNDNGNRIRRSFLSEPTDHGDSMRKFSNKLTLKVKGQDAEDFYNNLPDTDFFALSRPMQSAVVGEAYSHHVPRVKAFHTDVWTWTVTGLPPGLYFDYPGEQITGTPTVAGSYTITYTLTNPVTGFVCAASVDLEVA
jgi:hypothetical protein